MGPSMMVCLGMFLLVCAFPLYAQIDDGDLTLNRNIPPDDCPTYDACTMATGFSAVGMTSCTATRCLACGNDAVTGKASCYYAPSGSSGSCQCSTRTVCQAEYNVYSTFCEGRGQCTYRE
jgi:hypothetical protein